MKRKTTHRKNILAVFFVLLFLLLIALLGLMLFWRISDNIKARREPVCKQVSMSEEAAAKAYVWLNQIEEMPLSYEDVRDIIGEVSVEVMLTPTGEDGLYEQALSEETYIDCVDKTKKGLKKAYMEVLQYRLRSTGYEGDLSDEVLEGLMKDTYGISVSEYLEHCNVQLLPGLGELKEKYSGEVAYEKN